MLDSSLRAGSNSDSAESTRDSLSVTGASTAISALAALFAGVGELCSLRSISGELRGEFSGEASPRGETSRDLEPERFGFGFALSHSRARVTRWSCRSSFDSASGKQPAAGPGAEAPPPEVNAPSPTGEGELVSSGELVREPVAVVPR